MGGWWSVIGQTFDLLGFAILSTDLYREYRRFRRKANLKIAINEFDELKSFEPKGFMPTREVTY